MQRLAVVAEVADDFQRANLRRDGDDDFIGDGADALQSAREAAGLVFDDSGQRQFLFSERSCGVRFNRGIAAIQAGKAIQFTRRRPGRRD